MRIRNNTIVGTGFLIDQAEILKDIAEFQIEKWGIKTAYFSALIQ
ncbi:hypothetical protein B6N60_04777 [Richelia sinica FACHB-800]|uniref:Uncharacterized protein n=1 Tax=Richelia sinica FACHB-800 TaxID=1357546 RepID=A0A975TC59_9NOST|nr:hypothetical protein B6N60_04777 [Richelia sinica FACHB-800]